MTALPRLPYPIPGTDTVLHVEGMTYLQIKELDTARAEAGEAFDERTALLGKVYDGDKPAWATLEEMDAGCAPWMVKELMALLVRASYGGEVADKLFRLAEREALGVGAAPDGESVRAEAVGDPSR